MTEDGGYREAVTEAFGDLIPLADFREAVRNHSFIDYDGHGHPVKGGLMDPDIWIKPSRLGEIPEDAESIMWYNR